MKLGVAILLAYLVGGIPFAAIAARAKGIDLRAKGSGNLGATNAIRVLGAKVGIPVLLADVLKGWVGAALIPAAFTLGSFEARVACGAAAIAGHIFPVFLGFRGGKGVATSAGVFLALAPIPIGLAIAAFALVLLVTRYVSLASLVASATLGATLWMFELPRMLQVAGSVIALLVMYRHRSNWKRILEGTESRVGPIRRPGGSP